MLFYILAIYPFFAFLFRQIIDVRPNFVFSIIYFSFFLYIILTKKNVRLPKYLLFYLFFVVYTIVGDVNNGKIDNQEFVTMSFGLPLFITYFMKNNVIATFFIFFIVENSFFPKSFIKNIIKIIFVVVVVAVIVIIIQAYSPKFFLSPREFDIAIDRGEQRKFSIFSWINTSEAGYTFPAFLSILLSLSIIYANKIKVKWLYFFGIIYSVLSGARFVILSVLIVFSQTISYRKKFMPNLIKAIGGLVFLFAISYFVLKFSGINIDRMISHRIIQSDVVEFEKNSAYTRIYAFTLFSEFFPERPIFGTGGVMEDDLIETKGSTTSQIHVGWLSLLYYYGIVGGTFHIIFTYLIMKKLYRVAKTTNYWGSFFVFITYFISVMGTGVSFEINFMGYIFALVLNKYFEQQLNQKNSINII